MKSILVAIEFPVSSKSVLDIAKKFAREFKAKLNVMHSESVDSYINHIISEDNLTFSNNLMLEYRKKYEKLMTDLQKELVAEHIESECILVEGPTVDCILSVAKEVKAEMIILGSHEHGKFYHLLMGSTHNLLIKKSEIPILIIPPHIN